MGLLEKKFKREHFPIDGVEDLRIRPMKDSETKRQQAMSTDELKVWFSMGMCLMNSDGTLLFSKVDEETDTEFANRVTKELDDADFDLRLMGQVCNAIGKVTKFEVGDIKKNSPMTLKQDSQDV